ncbi:hypothetical protein N7462_002756 [Penicillium macrosclerotiorum]|uniref:uncharacterized protein n=1 Tax=Penicillium macrosclerotiorum TaxID=303699 RepID=UPI002549A691|nr:uncharacterized protein N7462_002756 [Penicillium macrosclerotiorum]KAJ5693333.1 hypothetical protein N7462_002756 [Penicillium macrosclerotiorum]
MEHSHPHSRRLVTYGSSSNKQSGLKTMSSRTSIAKTSKESKGSLGKTRQSRTTTLQGSGNEHDYQKPTTPGATNSPHATQRTHRPPEDANIFEIPSSDEEAQDRIMRRKRRRFGANEDATAPRHLPNLHKPIEIESKPEFRDGSAGADIPDPSNEMASPHSKKSAREPGLPPRKKKDSARSVGLQKQDIRPIVTRNPKAQTQGVAYSGRDEPADKIKIPPRSTEALATSPLRQEKIIPRSSTPTRRRLIDSLGTREPSADPPSSPAISSTSQPPSPFTPHSPNRTREMVPHSARIESRSKDISQDSPATHSAHLSSSKVTYARQRSFLDDLLEDALFDAPLSVESGQETSASGQFKMRGNIPRARLFAIEEANDDDGSVRSIHELRQAGGNARYRGAVESIFEDLEDSNVSASARCNALVQLCGKLLDPKLAQQFVECNFDKRLVDGLSSNFDKVSSSLSLCVFALSSLGRSLPYVLATAAWPKLLKVSSGLLDSQDDICFLARDRASNLSKAAQNSVQNITPQIKSTLFPDTPSSKLSPCYLILFCLRVIMSAYQAKGESPDGLPIPVLKQLVDLLLSESSHSKNALAVQRQIMVPGLVILEFHTGSVNPSQEDHRDVLSLLAGMHELLQVDEKSDATFHQTQSVYLRVLLNITNNNQMLCDDFATWPMIQALVTVATTRFGELTEDALEQENNSLDTVILALGALINLVEQSEGSRSIFLQSPSTGQPLLERLLQLFVSHADSTSKAHSVLEVHHNVAVGYLAVLLLALCLSTDVRFQVKKYLHPKGLTTIMSTVDEFLQYHKKIEQEVPSFQTKGDPSGFLVRLEDLISQIQRIDNE